ncbi:hypothetical protein GF352_03350, partial [archaeon]|nr:hypothetical protein [archaeon]
MSDLPTRVIKKQRELLDNLSSDNANVIQEFLDSRINREVKPTTFERYVNHLHLLLFGFVGNLKQLTKEDRDWIIERFRAYKAADATKTGLLISLKTFFKWVDNDLEDSSGKNLRLFKDLQYKDTRAKIGINDLISERDFQQLIRGCRSSRERAFLAIFYDCGVRPIELVNIKLGDISVNPLGIDLVIRRSKTKHGVGRTVSVVKHRDLLLDYL